MLSGFVANTDYEWFRFLRERSRRWQHALWPDETKRSGITAQAMAASEVNFWFPSPRQSFRALLPGEPLFFRLKGSFEVIGGFGFFVHFTRLPLWLAWETFGEGNGCATVEELAARIASYRSQNERLAETLRAEIGCAILENCVFFEERDFVPQPRDWSAPIMRGKTYSLYLGEGLRIWEECQKRALHYAKQVSEIKVETVVSLHAGGFRALVFDTYQRRCAVTRQRSLPVLEAAIIRPDVPAEELSVRNGLLLRADLRRLFEHGYVTVTPDYRFEVSRRLSEDWPEEWPTVALYDRLRGAHIYVPEIPSKRPDPALLRWHNENVFIP
jgi:putative restriction endonuclease